MGKKKSCQKVKVPRPLNAVEQRLYGWVEEAVFTQPSVVLADVLPESRRSMRLTEDATAEGDFVLEASGDDFQREVMTRCHVAVSQLHLNAWAIMRTFEQEFKWHYFKVLPSPGRRAFWLNDEGKPFPWVYWNRGVKDFTVQNLDPLEMAVCDFLLSLPVGLDEEVFDDNFTLKKIPSSTLFPHIC
ncbi:hypothetical protein PIB30_061773 [Stylosanthes scabra]|uniref:Uncharacterized protein n=1 Tax=Stylosanthes scabra TaxID=79078 RepID=A0ABU6YKC1_9FABA|nr:hypothetical protein [Stylosanthes scabra]